MPGRLLLFPSPISDSIRDNFGSRHLDSLFSCRHFVCERARTTRRWLSALSFPVAISELHILEMEAEANHEIVKAVITWCNAGHDVGVLSEAGTPCIADPGSSFVAAAHTEGISVVPYVGPNSIILALMASGLNGNAFTFNGYLPIKEGSLKTKLDFIVKDIQKNQGTHIWIETPYRNDRMFSFLLKQLPNAIKLCVAISIGNEDEQIITRSIQQWKKEPISIGKRNTIFLVGR